MAQRHPELELDLHLRQTHRQWQVERIAWVLLALLLAAVALGLFGRGGPLSAVTLQTPDGRVQVEHQRFLRSHSPDRIELRVQGAAGTVQVSIAQAVLERVDIEATTPPARQVTAREGATDYLFSTAPGSNARIVLRLMPEQPGPVRGWITVDDQRLPLRQFVYP